MPSLIELSLPSCLSAICVRPLLGTKKLLARAVRSRADPDACTPLFFFVLSSNANVFRPLFCFHCSNRYGDDEEVDVKTEAVWLGHPRHLVFDNSTDFEAKLSRLTTAASRLVGLPCRPRKMCKFLLYEPPPPLEEFPVPTKEFHAEKVSVHRGARD